MLIVFQCPDILYGIIGDRVEIHFSFSILETCKNVLVHLFDLPILHPVVGAGHIGNQLLLRSLWISISMKPATQCGGQFRVDAVCFEKYPVVSRMGRFVIMTKSRSIVSRRDLSRDRQQGNMQQVPVSFIGMCKSINYRVFVLIPGSASKLGYRAQLNHGVGKRRARKNFGSPGTLFPGAYISQIFRFPQRGCPQKRIDVIGELFFCCCGCAVQ
ncbi:hypothetical protein SDC9_74941 [bioreactor metagenome]|uniref:Uncharacterized protein n=1 Tax=bioreactor metagenome TaxID=1076179 RepID=A0A644YJA0_9ZZZZ